MAQLYFDFESIVNHFMELVDIPFHSEPHRTLAVNSANPIYDNYTYKQR